MAKGRDERGFHSAEAVMGALRLLSESDYLPKDLQAAKRVVKTLTMLEKVDPNSLKNKSGTDHVALNKIAREVIEITSLDTTWIQRLVPDLAHGIKTFEMKGISLLKDSVTGYVTVVDEFKKCLSKYRPVTVPIFLHVETALLARCFSRVLVRILNP